jgi:hypothetical protein
MSLYAPALSDIISPRHIFDSLPSIQSVATLPTQSNLQTSDGNIKENGPRTYVVINLIWPVSGLKSRADQSCSLVPIQDDPNIKKFELA